MAPPRTARRLPRPQALPVQFRQLAQHLLQFLPGRDPVAPGLGQALRHGVAGGGALRPPKTHIKVRAVFGPLVTAAAGPTKGTIALGESASGEARDLG